MTGPRELAQRKTDCLAKLAGDDDVWVATTDGPGEPCLVPLSFAWVDERVILVTPRNNRTARNIGETSSAHLALGPTRDVVSLEGVAEVHPIGEVDDKDAEAFVSRTGWDPRRPLAGMDRFPADSHPGVAQRRGARGPHRHGRGALARLTGGEQRQPLALRRGRLERCPPTGPGSARDQ